MENFSGREYIMVDSIYSSNILWVIITNIIANTMGRI